MEKKPTRKQINFAAKLYSLAILSEVDFSQQDAPTKVRQQIVKAVSTQADAALRMYGVGGPEVASLDKALAVAMRLRP